MSIAPTASGQPWELQELPESGAALTAQQAQAIEKLTRALLSAEEGHDYYAPPAVQEKLALDDAGTLYLTEGAEADILVMGYLSMLDRIERTSDGRRRPYKEKKIVPYSQLRRLSEAAAEARRGNRETWARRSAEQAQIISILTEAARLKASDAFLIMDRTEAQIHYRIAGDIERRFRMPSEKAKRLIQATYDSMSEASDAHYDPTNNQHARFNPDFIDGMGLHQVRITTGPTDQGNRIMALRLHYDFGDPKSLPELGFSQTHADLIDEGSEYSYGINLFSGSTGSGKSTSLANHIGFCQRRDNYRREVITLEDPPEIPIEGAIQKAVLRGEAGNRAAEERAWVEGFETLMRLNPDWIVAGELRLKATMDAALKASLTGHLTWGMLHASSATLVLERLREEGIGMGYLTDPDVFRILANQSLAPVLCPRCSTTYVQDSNRLSKPLRTRIETHCTPDTVRLRNPLGCPDGNPDANGQPQCYHGVLPMRTICAEVMRTDHKSLTVYRKTNATALRRYWVHEMSGITKTMHLIEKIDAGLVDPADGERIVSPLNTDNLLADSTN